MLVDKIKFKRSRQAGYIPTVEDVGSEGELFINLADQKVYTINDSGEVVSVGGGASGSNSFLREDREWTDVKGQTAFNIPYYLGNELVTYNGLELSKKDYTAEDGKVIILKNPVAGDTDVIRIKSYMGGDVVTDTFAGQPVGTISQFLKGKIPEGQLVCDGSNFSKLDYPSLYDYLGTETLPNLNDSQVGDIMPWMSDKDIPEGWHHLGIQNEEEFNAEPRGRFYSYREYPELCDFLNRQKGLPTGVDARLELNGSGEVFRQCVKWRPDEGRDYTKAWDWQTDAIRPVTGEVGYLNSSSQHHEPFLVSGVFTKIDPRPNAKQFMNSSACLPNEQGHALVHFDISRVHPTSKDVRMTNRSVNYLIKVKPTSTTSQTVFCIKAAGKLNEEGLMQVTALKEKVAQLEAEMPSKPNLFINGDFSVNQRYGNNINRVFPLGGAYFADRWYCEPSSASASWAAESVSPRVGSPFNEPYLYFRMEDADDNAGIYQKMDNPYRFAGKTLTFSIETRHDGVRSFGLFVSLVAGGRSVEGFDFNPDHWQNIEAINGEWVKLTCTFTIPASWDGSNYVNANDSLNIGFLSRMNVAGVYRYRRAKLEEGSVATPFVPDDPATNLAKCQRYYERVLCMFDGQQPKGGSNASSTVRFTPKRVRVNGTELHRELSGSLLVVNPFLESYEFAGFPDSYGYRYRIQFSPDSTVTRTGGLHTLFEINAEL